MAASMAMSPNDKNDRVVVVYEESDVKNNPHNQTHSPEKSILLSSKNFKIKSPESLTPLPTSNFQNREPLC
jgi:hypothetical protein